MERPKLYVRLYSRPGCCLCDEAAHMLEQLRAEFHFHLEYINIDGDPVLQQKFCCQIPVITMNGGNRVALRITPERLRRALRRASQCSLQRTTPAPDI